jgi:hypothetical protein
VRQSDAALNLAYDLLATKEGLSASQTNIWDLLESIVRRHPNFTFVVDGLDECHRPAMEWKNGQSKRREDFLRKLKETLGHTNSWILIVSRDVSDIRSQLCDYGPQVEKPTMCELSISKNNVRNDVIRFSEHTVRERLSKTDKVPQERLAMEMANRSEGMFLWIRLQKDRLRGSKRFNQLSRIINETPDNLEQFYERSWTEISSLPRRDRYRAEAILRWTTFALRPTD